MKPQPDLRAGAASPGSRPGSDAAALRIITAAVLAGLVITGFVLVPHDHQHLPAGMGPPGHPGGSAQQAGLRLLGRAAQACRSVSYQALEELDWRNPAGPAAAAVEIWHVRGGQTLMKTVGGDAGAGDVRRALTFSAPGSTPMLEGTQLPGMSERLVTLLGANYRLEVAGTGWAAGRRATLVTARRPDASLAGRFWLDASSGLPLRRQTFDTSGRLISDARFAELAFTHVATKALRSVMARRPLGTILARAQLARLRSSGWPLPRRLPANLTLLAARESSTAAGPAVGLDYTDGLSEVSLLVQRGHVSPGLGGWSQATVGGQRVYADSSPDRSVAWSANGFVYLVIAAAPQQTIGQVVATLPHDGAPGIPTRIARGLRRLLSLMNL